MKYKIADLIVEYDSKYELTEKRSEKYKLDNDLETDIKISVTDKEIEKLEKDNPIDLQFSEYMLIGDYFYRGLINYNGCILHSSAVVVDNEAYLFSADCGVGKSTHTSLWLKYLKEKNPYILNDDKPAIRIIDNEIYAYGTPFSGKHDISENKRVKIKGICFIERGKTNHIERINSETAIKLFFEQTIRKLDKKTMSKFLDVLEKIITEIPIYKLQCDMSKEAVELSYNTLKGNDKNED